MKRAPRTCVLEQQVQRSILARTTAMRLFHERMGKNLFFLHFKTFLGLSYVLLPVGDGITKRPSASPSRSTEQVSLLSKERDQHVEVDLRVKQIASNFSGVDRYGPLSQPVRKNCCVALNFQITIVV